MNVEIGYIDCPLEGRFTQVRTRESNLGECCIPAPTQHIMLCLLGNLVADIMRRATKADCAILNSGTLRSDVVHDTGVFKMRVSCS